MASAATTIPITRDRAGTEQAILDAAKQVLAEGGFSAFGVNAIARRAGCDKQLIYRYYGGLDGLVDAIGKDLADLFQELMEEPDADAGATYAAFVEHLILALLAAFRRSDLLLRIAAWEVLDPSPVTRRLADVRGRALGAWIQARRGDLSVPEGVDAGAVNAVLIAAVQHLALAARAVGNFSNVALESDADWQRIEDTLRALVRASYRGGLMTTTAINFGLGPGMIKSVLTLRTGNAWVHAWGYHAVEPRLIIDTPFFVKAFGIG